MVTAGGAMQFFSWAAIVAVAGLAQLVTLNPQMGAVLPDDQELELLMAQLKEPCHTLLIGFYYQRMSLEQLAKELHYASPNVAKQMKFRCLERLRKRLDHKGPGQH